MKPVIILVSVFMLSVLLFRWFVVYLTGILEYLFGISLFLIQTSYPGSVVLILLLLLLLPANICAAVNRIHPEKADYPERE
ncbi:MAG TPA: hypothetical protein VL053_03635 [Arachidicoccus sp.]|nr:hypothetical protein [Arachidicoccus sp.]